MTDKPYIPPHVHDVLDQKDPVYVIEDQIQEIDGLLDKGFLAMPDMAEYCFGIQTCTSCRKWWPALFIGASIGFATAAGPLSWLSASSWWFGFWYAIYLYINHPTNTYTKDEPFKGKSFMATVDSILGSKDQNFIYYTCLTLCAAVITPFVPSAVFINFIVVWMIFTLFLRLILRYKITRLYDDKIKNLSTLKFVRNKKRVNIGAYT
jgi:hypothetical protein